MENTEKHKYTQEEFDTFLVICGVKQCPTGDYSEIKHFGEKCSFGEHCSFGERCSFGNRCSFGEWCYFGVDCSFGARCSFGNHCYFGVWCSFGEDCIFGKYCSFEKGCSFEKHCTFGEDCSFDEHCSFGERCSFKKGCVCEFGEFSQVCSFVEFGRNGYTIYAFALTDGNIGIRWGTFAGNLDEFRAEVKEMHGDSKIAKYYLAKIAKYYLAIADLVSLRFGKA